jgi:hypothetical protein
VDPPPKSDRLHAFIAAAKSNGASDQFLFDLLRHEGWAAGDIYAAFAQYYENLTGLPMPQRGGGPGEAARDAFLYLLAFSTLATWTTALGSLMFAFINRWFPDPSAVRTLDSRDQISSQMACLIVALPVFLLVMRFILRGEEARPDKLESDVRRWLTYIALLIAACILISDLIAFLTYFLQGEITTRFVLKVLTVLVIAGGIFWYYLASLRKGVADASA